MSSLPRTRGPKPIRLDPDHILDAAQAIFAQEGLQAASLRAIAHKAGCDPSLIYYHFKNKEQLFKSLLDRRFPAILREIEPLAEDSDFTPTSLRLWNVLGIYQRHLKHDPGLRSMIRGEIVKGAEGLADLIQTQIRPILQTVGRIFGQGIARGELRPELQPLLSTFFLVRMQLEILDLLPAVLPSFADLDPETAVRSATQAWFKLFWRGVAADPTVPLPPLPDFVE